MVAKHLVVMSPGPTTSFKVLLPPEMGPGLCPAPPLCQPWWRSRQAHKLLSLPAARGWATCCFPPRVG